MEVSDTAILAYQISGYVVIGFSFALLVWCMLAMFYNKFADWSPHPDLFLYLLGNIMTTVAFIIGWYYSYGENYEVPVYFTGEALAITSLLTICNKQNNNAVSHAKQFLPFYSFRVNGTNNHKYIKQWLSIVWPNAIIIVVSVFGVIFWSDVLGYKITLSVVESLLSVYLCILVLLSSIQYKKWCDDNDRTDVAKWYLFLAWMCLLDTVLSHTIYVLVQPFADKDQIIGVVYCKDWISLLNYAVIDVIILMILKCVFKQMKELRRVQVEFDDQLAYFADNIEDQDLDL